MSVLKDQIQREVDEMNESEKDTIISFLLGLDVHNVASACAEVRRQRVIASEEYKKDTSVIPGDRMST